MKRIFILTLILAVILAFIPCFAHADVYPLTTQVVEIDAESDIVIVETYLGLMYAFYGAENWDIGDCCTCIMFDNYTPEITDDEVVEVAYSPWILTHSKNYPNF